MRTGGLAVELKDGYIENLEFIGSGTYGKIYRDKNVVYKLYKKEIRKKFYDYDYDSNPCLHKSIFNNLKLNHLISLSGKIKWGNLVFDRVYMNGEFIGVATEYFEGITLRNARDELSFADKIKISQDIILGTEELMQNGIYPLDLHLSNILIDKDLKIKIIDLDDTLTKFRTFSDPLITRWGYANLMDTLTDFLEYKHDYNIVNPKFISSRRLRFRNSSDGVRSYLEYKNLPKKLLFISLDTDISLIKKYYSKDYEIIFIIDDDKIETMKDRLEIDNALKNLYTIGIPIEKAIRIRNFNYFLETINVVSYDDLVDNRERHVLIKK